MGFELDLRPVRQLFRLAPTVKDMEADTRELEGIIAKRTVYKTAKQKLLDTRKKLADLETEISRMGTEKKTRR